MAISVAAAACGGGGGAVDAGAPDAAAPTCLAAAPDAAPPDPGCPAPLPPADQRPDRLDEALEIAGLDRCTLGFAPGTLELYPENIAADADRLPWYHDVWSSPLRALDWSEKLLADADAALAATSGARAIVEAAARLGYDVSVCDDASGAPAGETPLADAVADLIGAGADVDALRADAAAVPLDLQRAVAKVVRAAGIAAAAREEALEMLDEDERLVDFYQAMGFTSPTGSGPLTTDWLGVLRGERFDHAAMYRGAASLAFAIESAGWPAAVDGAFSFVADTPLGQIVVSGTADDSYDGETHALLVVDAGGADRYTGAYAATPDSEHGVGVVVDLGGSDIYDYVVSADPNDVAPRLPSDEAGRAAPSELYGAYSRSTTPRQGSGVLGIGLLYDLGDTRDEYHSLRTSQGHGALGVGVLVDAGGDDLYLAEAGAQGAAAYGIGILLDAGGADERRAYYESQGFAYVRAAGFLLDGGDGADVYWSEPLDVVYYSPQLPGTGNTSLTQGAGFGRRGDADGIFQSGGLALLRDGGGDDAYTASVFAQGTGYWFGTGILADAGGDDGYDGAWYVQGSAAHFALCLFIEDDGADRYNQTAPPAATSIGVGHDWSVGFHVDRGGDDVYRAPGLSLGAGNANGVGVLVNVGGDDEYRAAGEPTIGAANLSGEIAVGTPREAYETQGLFLDVGGSDVYDVPGSTVTRGDDTSWTNNRRVPPLASEHSAGLDAADGDVLLP